MTYRGYETEAMTLTLATSKKQPAWIAEVTGKDEKFELSRNFLESVKQGGNWSEYQLAEGKIYNWKQDKVQEFGKVIEGELVIMTKNEAIEALEVPEVIEVTEETEKSAPEKTYAEIEITFESLAGKKAGLKANDDTRKFEAIYKNISGLMQNLDKVQNLSVKAYDDEFVAKEITLEQALEEIKKYERNNKK